MLSKNSEKSPLLTSNTENNQLQNFALTVLVLINRQIDELKNKSITEMTAPQLAILNKMKKAMQLISTLDIKKLITNIETSSNYFKQIENTIQSDNIENGLNQIVLSSVNMFKNENKNTIDKNEIKNLIENLGILQTRSKSHNKQKFNYLCRLINKNLAICCATALCLAFVPTIGYGSTFLGGYLLNLLQVLISPNGYKDMGYYNYVYNNNGTNLLHCSNFSKYHIEMDNKIADQSLFPSGNIIIDEIFGEKYYDFFCGIVNYLAKQNLISDPVIAFQSITIGVLMSVDVPFGLLTPMLTALLPTITAVCMCLCCFGKETALKAICAPNDYQEISKLKSSITDLNDSLAKNSNTFFSINSKENETTLVELDGKEENISVKNVNEIIIGAENNNENESETNEEETSSAEKKCIIL